MKIKRRLIIIEPECKSPSGHGLSSLEQYYNFFKAYINIICVTNKQLKKKNFFNKKIINHFAVGEEFFKIKKISDFFLIFLKIFLFAKECLVMIFFLIIKKKMLKFFKCFFFNSCKIPRYFPALLNLTHRLSINNNDIFFIPSGRPAILQSLYFLINICPEIFPKTHFRIVHPVKWRGLYKDNFFKFLNYFIKKKLINKKLFCYAENIFYKKTLEKFNKLNTTIFNGLNYSRKIKKNSKVITIGFLGSSQKFKGFHKIPFIIENLQKKFNNLKFIIQINKPDTELDSIIKKIFKLKIKQRNIKIYNGTIKNNEFTNILNKINIFPLMHSKKRAKTFGSGFIYTAIGSGICMVIPKDVPNWKRVINGKSYLEASSDGDYIKKISTIISNYPKFLKLAIRTRSNYYNDLKNNSLITRIINN